MDGNSPVVNHATIASYILIRVHYLIDLIASVVS